jgi:recombination protein RecR
VGLIPPSVERLTADFARLPGIGPKTAQRLAFHCLRAPREPVERLAEALLEVRAKVGWCSRCFFIAEGELCGICSNPRRDQGLVCVVEEAADVLAVERSGEFNGLYHVLGGSISPIDGVGPDQLRISELETRLAGGGVTEVILATDPDIEGEATAHYLAEELNRLGVRVTRLAHGLPAGSNVQYADEVTVARAFTGRRSL